LRLAAGLAGLAISLSGCSAASEAWDKVFSKDDTFVEEPAEKLYNEGLFLMNEGHDPKGRRRNSRKSIASILIPTWRANRC
jgi:outer membrane protein assembly factor BamD